MEPIGLLIGALLALVFVLILLRTEERTEEVEESEVPSSRILDLCRRLTGHPERDRAIENQILTLGDAIAPTLLSEISRIRHSAHADEFARLATLEKLVADFGLGVLDPLMARLSRIHPTSPLAPSMLRVIAYIGRSGTPILMNHALENKELMPFIPHLSRHLDDAELVKLVKARSVEKRASDLTALAGSLARRPQFFSIFWRTGHTEDRIALLNWLEQWLPLVAKHLIEEGLGHDEPRIQCAAARVASLLVDPSLIDPLTRLAQSADDTVRTLGIQALAAQDNSLSRPILEDALGDPSERVASTALCALLTAEGPKFVLKDARHLIRRGTALSALCADLTEQEDGRTFEKAIVVVDGPDHQFRAVAARYLAAHSQSDPRARERLIRLADSTEHSDRVHAVSALAQVGDRAAQDLLVRVLRTPTEGDLLPLEEAAQNMGADVVPVLARRLRPHPPGRLEATLSVLRTLPYESAVGPLLHGLEDARNGSIECLMGATLALGGETIQQGIIDALRQPKQGLVVPALRYLSVHGGPSSIPLLLDVFRQHPPLRSLILNLIETYSEDGLAALEAEIESGGEDQVLDSLEERLALMRVCLSHK